VLICTEHAQQPSVLEEFSQLAPHDVLKKWLYIDSRDEDFEHTMEGVAKAIARDVVRLSCSSSAVVLGLPQKDGSRNILAISNLIASSQMLPAS
jgi:hypothetical protein